MIERTPLAAVLGTGRALCPPREEKGLKKLFVRFSGRSVASTNVCVARLRQSRGRDTRRFLRMFACTDPPSERTGLRNGARRQIIRVEPKIETTLYL
jgi:hypothetical protein